MATISEKERIRKVEVLPHNPDWKTLFHSESRDIASALGNNLINIHHIGSTAIPNIKAKPIIDVLPVVKSLEELDAATEKMVALGYEPMGEYGIVGRRFFFKVVNGVRLYHVHAFKKGNTEIQRHLNFVSYLLAYPEMAKLYSLLKEELAKQFPTDIESYVNGKSAFVRNIDAQASAKITTMKVQVPARKQAPATQLYVKTVTQGEPLGARPVAFILPGGPGMDHTAYEKYSCLIDVADIVYHDPRGCGQSDKGDPLTYTMENYIDDVEAIRQQLGLQRVIIIGKSYGSMCAIGYALRYPKATEKLVLAAGAPSFRFLAMAKENLLRRGTAAQIKMGEKLWASDFNSKEDLVEFFTIMAPLYSNRAKQHAGGFSLAQTTSGYSYQALNLGFRDFFLHFNYESELGQITCPTLILAGEDDWVNDVQIAKLMAEKIPRNRLRVFADSGHSMEADVPFEYFQEIRNFI